MKHSSLDSGAAANVFDDAEVKGGSQADRHRINGGVQGGNETISPIWILASVPVHTMRTAVVPTKKFDVQALSHRNAWCIFVVVEVADEPECRQQHEHTQWHEHKQQDERGQHDRPHQLDTISSKDSSPTRSFARSSNVLDASQKACVVRDANMGHQLAGGNSIWCPELKSRTTHLNR